MHKVSRCYVANAGFKLAWYDGQVLPFTDLGSGEPTHTILNLVNQGGKTTLLALLLSIFDPDRRRFLQTVSTPAHVFDDYFDKQGLPGIIAVEWRLPGDLASRVRPLVTGQIVCMRKSGDVTEPERWFFHFLSDRDLNLDALPGPGLDGGKKRQLKSFSEVQLWLREMREKHPGSFDYTQNQGSWREMLERLGLDVEMIRQQVDFNKKEGAMDEAFLDFKTEHDFVRRFLTLALDTAQADKVRDAVATHCRRVARRKPLQEALAWLNKLSEVLTPFAQAATAHDQAHRDFAAAQDRLAIAHATLEALAKARDEAARVAREHADVQDGVAKQAAATKLASVKDIEAYTAELKRRARVSAEAARQTAEALLKSKRDFVRLLDAARLLDEMQSAQAAIAQFEKSIELANQNEVAPLRAELGRCGALYAHALEEAKRFKLVEFGAEEARLAGLDRERARLTGEEQRQREAENTHRTAAARLDGYLEMAEQERTRLVDAKVLSEGSSVDQTLQELDAQHEGLSIKQQRAEDAAAQAHENGQQAASRRNGLAAQRGAAHGKCQSLRKTIEEGQRLREQLQSTRILCRAAGAELADVDSEVLPARLTHLTEQLREQHNTARLELARLQEARRSIELHGLAGHDPDVAKVVKSLTDAGVKHVRSHAAYVAEVVPDEALARELVTSDPARFLGVAVATAAQLAEARKLITKDLPLARPVQVSVATDKAQAEAATAFVVPAVDNALYHFGAAQRRLKSLAPDEDIASRQAGALQHQLDEAGEAKVLLTQYWTRFGEGKLTRLRAEADAADAELRGLDQQLDAADRLIPQYQQQERDARETATRMRQGLAALNTQRQVLCSYRDQYERKLPGWLADRAQHRAALATLTQAFEQLDQQRVTLETARNACIELKLRLESDASGLAQRRAAVTVVDSAHDAAAALRLAPQSLEALGAAYDGATRALRAVEEEKTGPLVVERNARSEELARHRIRWEREFKGIPDAEARSLVGVDYDRESVTARAETQAADTARSQAVAAEGSARGLEKDFAQKRTYPQHTIAHVEGLTDGALTFALTEKEAEAQRAAQLEESARKEQDKAGKEASRLTHEARDLANHAKQLKAQLPDGPAALLTDERLFPSVSEVGEVCAGLARALNESRSAMNRAHHTAATLHERVKAIVAEEAFARADLETAMALRSNTLEASMGDHARITKALVDRKTAVESELGTMHSDFERAAELLNELVTTALRILRRATEALSLPESAPIVGGLAVLKMPKTVLHFNQEQRRERLRPYLEELVGDGNVPESGAALTTTAVLRLANNHLGLQILKIVADKDEQYIPVDRLSHSGAEKIAMALFLYFVIARLRYEQRVHLKKAEGGVLFLDNPFAKATARPIWQAIVGLADSMGVQLVITTGVKEYEALSVFTRFVRLAPGQDNKTNGRRHIKVVDYQFRPEDEHKELVA